MSRSNIELINRFNGGNGGVSLILKEETGRFGMGGVEEVTEHGTFLEVPDALQLAADLVESAIGSWNQRPVAGLADAIALIRAFANEPRLGRLVLPVKGP